MITLSPYRARRLLAPGPKSPPRDRRQRGRDQGVIAGERNAEKAPGRLVAPRDMDRLQILEQAARRAHAAERARAIARARPQFPFDAGMKHAEPGVPDESERDHGERREQH